jgi:hypothetical protein
MRSRLLSVLAVLALAATPTAALADGGTHATGHHATSAATAAKSCGRGYVKAKIGGQTKCLRRGEYCAKKYASQYRKYGFTCSGNPARLH